MNICPIMSYGKGTIGTVKCKEDQCVWWVKKKMRNEQLITIKYEACAIKVLAEK